MRLTAMTYNLMRVLEEVSKIENSKLIHPSDKNIPKYLRKETELQKKQAGLLTRYFFNQGSYEYVHILFG
jgi:hypothetical protein